MNKKVIQFLSIAFLVSLVGCVKSNEPKIAATKNPFGVKDVGDINYDEVRKFASTTALSGAANDPNGEKWTEQINGMTGFTTIEGNWESRWNGGSAGTEWRKGKAQIKKIADDYFILYEDNSRYLIEGKTDNDVLIGRYINLNSAGDAGPWVGKVVGTDRIDGQWSQGRWDFRR